jgi:hypothetical protein
VPPDTHAALVLVLATAASLCAWPLRTVGRPRRALALGALAALLLPLPFLLPPETSLGWRIAVGAGIPVLVLKLRDLHIGASWWCTQRGRRWVLTVVVPFVLVPRAQDAAPRPSTRHFVRQLAIGLVEVGIGWALLRAAQDVDWTQVGFAAEHVTRVLLLYLVGFDGGLAVLGALLGLVGLARLPFTRHPIVAITPADFWRRYNLEAGRWFHHDVFVPAAGRRHPVRATLLTFLVSGLLHEYLAAVLLGRVQGYQLACFLLHGLAVVLTFRLRPRGATRLVGGALTFSFVMAAAVLFFASIENIAPGRFYRSGAWLP